MTVQEIRTTLYAFVLERFPAARSHGLTETDSLIAHGIIDSLGVLEIVSFIEEHFGIALADDELVADHFDSLPALAELVHSKLICSDPCNI
jgi:acyl carrier protein